MRLAAAPSRVSTAAEGAGWTSDAPTPVSAETCRLARGLQRRLRRKRNVSAREPTTSKTGNSSDAVAPASRAENLLVVEPEELVRWSLVTYLGRWFAVFAPTSGASAESILEERRIDAVIVSDDLAGQAAERIAALARSRNPSVKIVRTLSGPGSGNAPPGDEMCLEKPFDLSELAALLGVEEASHRTSPKVARYSSKAP